MLANIRSVRNQLNSGRLQIEVEQTKPDCILLTETWLDDSTQEVVIPGYRSIARRDRSGDKSGGGVDIFVRDGFWNVGLHSISKTSERSWVTLHTDTGPILVGVWYRPPGEIREELQTLAREVEEYSVGHIGTIVCCDANVHHSRWLKFSDGNTGLGQDLKDICDNAGLTQIVHEPTRKQNLLDLVLTSMPDISKATVLSSISDHRGVLIEVALEVPKSIEIEREVWIYQKADWQGLKDALKERSWEFLKSSSVDQGAKGLTDIILETAKTFIPKRKIKQQKSSHPWLTEECREALLRKNEIEADLLKTIQSPERVDDVNGLEHRLQEAVRYSNEMMSKAFERHVENTREKIRSLPKGSKEWWRLNRSLLGRSHQKNVSFPPLRDKDRSWILESEKKADLFS